MIMIIITKMQMKDVCVVSLEDNEKLRRGEADVQVLTCTEDGRSRGTLSWRETQTTKKELISAVCLDIYVISKSGVTSAVKEDITE